MKTIILAQDERIVAVVPEYCSGSGWSNEVVWVYIMDSSEKLRVESIQADEMTPEMRTLFGVAVAGMGALFAAVPTRKTKKETS